MKTLEQTAALRIAASCPIRVMATFYNSVRHQRNDDYSKCYAFDWSNINHRRRFAKHANNWLITVPGSVVITESIH